MNALLERVVSYLPKSIQPIAKAVLPFALTLVAVLVQYALTGEFDKAELTTTITGISAALVTFLFPNIPPGNVDPAEGEVEGVVDRPH